VNDIWGETLPTAGKRLRVDENKNLGRRGIKWATGRGARDCAQELPSL
jgi:hypothetical protein